MLKQSSDVTNKDKGFITYLRGRFLYTKKPVASIPAGTIIQVDQLLDNGKVAVKFNEEVAALYMHSIFEAICDNSICVYKYKAGEQFVLDVYENKRMIEHAMDWL